MFTYKIVGSYRKINMVNARYTAYSSIEVLFLQNIPTTFFFLKYLKLQILWIC